MTLGLVGFVLPEQFAPRADRPFGAEVSGFVSTAFSS
jgi:hypothetical protein